jgi:hypothetical protein
MADTKQPKAPSEKPKGGGGGITETAGKFFIFAIILSFFKKFGWIVPFIIGLLIWLVTKNISFGLAAFFGSGIYFWKAQGGFMGFLIFLTIVCVIFGIPMLKDVFKTYMGTAWGGLSGGWSSVSSQAGCWICQGTTGLNNPAACEKKCGLEVKGTEPLLDISYEAPGMVSPERPISFNINMKLLAETQSVRNLAIDLWVANESGCEFGYCIPEEMYVCPKTSNCLKIIEMQCGDECDCRNSFCELNKDNPEITTNVRVYNPTCHSKRDIILYPTMETEYETTVGGYYTTKVSVSEAKSPTQDEKESYGPVSVSMKTDKDVYVLEKMSDVDFPVLIIKVANTGNGFAYIKSLVIKQEHAQNVEPFEITDCPGFVMDKSGEDVQLSLEEGKTTRIKPRDQWINIECDIKVPSAGIEKFNEYKFSSYVTYKYIETQELSTILLDCSQA